VDVINSDYSPFLTHDLAPVLTVPFCKQLFLNLSWLYILLVILVIVGSSNAVNLTDGLDGLAIGNTIFVALVYAILSYVVGNWKISQYLGILFVEGSGELTVFCTSLAGACLGFLWFNAYPAQVFMGDTGSLALGGAIGAVAIVTKQELLLIIAGGIFVAEALSVMIQVISFRLRGKRVFAIAPLHHIPEFRGWAEPKIIVRFWIISAILALISLSTLKLR
jgi:phospho-N-acetylmuramoyl-pentapeptide-transferase